MGVFALLLVVSLASMATSRPLGEGLHPTCKIGFIVSADVAPNGRQKGDEMIIEGPMQSMCADNHFSPTSLTKARYYLS